MAKKYVHHAPNDRFAICLMEDHTKFFLTKSGKWTRVFQDARIYSRDDREQTKLPKPDNKFAHVFWVSVLKGMGRGTLYPAIGELNNPATAKPMRT